MPELKWAVGLTTVPKRRDDLLPKTVHSLIETGFPAPHFFVDAFGEIDKEAFDSYGENVTIRKPRVKTAGNWILSLAELYVRNPKADRYLMCQDDFVCVSNLRAYLDQCEFPAKGYWNLITQMDNEELTKQEIGWHEGALVRNQKAKREGKQRGLGAVALVFDNKGVITLIQHPNMTDRLKNEDRGWRLIDGGIVEAMNTSGYREMVHNPSLVQHLGTDSTIERNWNPNVAMVRRPLAFKKWANGAKSFPGQSHDALLFLKK